MSFLLPWLVGWVIGVAVLCLVFIVAWYGFRQSEPPPQLRLVDSEGRPVQRRTVVPITIGGYECPDPAAHRHVCPRPKTPEELARELAMEPYITPIVLRQTLASLGYVEGPDGTLLPLKSFEMDFTRNPYGERVP